ncbi:conserved oligomeric Golgi complex subunit 4 [Anopheles ziemanni]|uniref:conserved oligomeric Golgi complex subunit 4 n=1 Tax=Anopheles coustani TaxID=139045 RepID=UPI002657BCEB|nr:conserved oligomeric Golgi complex subunit 4 [Anopheles coustani]XP_058166495.1 conserved oligomeric Golgi complex subunit 4 [Anopheles ziemanni]
MIKLESFIGDSDIGTSAGIEDVCEKISKKEQQIDSRLEEILSQQCQLEAKMRSIGIALSSLNVVSDKSRHLSEMINHTASLAESVSAKVRRLDEARSRVSECQQRVHDLIDLQLCSQGVMTAIREEDFEQGAAHVNRFLSMDKTLLQKTADDVSGSITSVSKAVSTLEQATVQIQQMVNQKFDEAVKRDDLASVERFFKIFPLLGMHDEGLEKFMTYICGKLQAKAAKELRSSMDIAKAEKRTAVAYADTLTILLENIARVIEVNQAIIENCYGPGRLVQICRILQRECDDEVTKCVQEFNRNRQTGRRIAQINDYIKSAGNSSSGMGHYRKASGGGGSIDKLNAKDIDSLIGEITIMHSRAELYVKFIKRRCTNDLEKSSLSPEVKQERLSELNTLLQKSRLNTQMQELLGTYLLFERYFMEESVLKAIGLDKLEDGQQCSSMLDDVFFIVRKCIRRSNGTQSLDGVCAVINNAASCLEEDFLKALKSPLKAGYPTGYIDLAQAYNAFQSSIQQGRLQTSDSDHARGRFIAALNNADMSTEFIETLWKMMAEEVEITFPTMSAREKEKLDSCLGGLKSFGDSLKALVDFGFQQLRSSAIKPRLHPWVDQFLTHNHNLTEEELATYEAGETFVQFLIVQIDGLLNSFKVALTPRNFDALVSIVTTEITTRMERAIKKTTFNRMGGLVLDQEVRALASFLTGATSWSVRDKLAKLLQMGTILNLESVSELPEYWESSSASWRLTANEARSILALRIDFKMEDIKKIKL